MARILLLDGNSIAYRAFFALPTDMATASGQVTNAVFGFTSMLINLLKDHEPDGIGIAFDRPERTFRHDLVPEYKAGRAEAPDILRRQMGLVRQVVETLRIPIVDAPGFEADDVEARLVTLLGNPSTCPHGNPIPGAEPPRRDLHVLAESKPGDRVRLERVTEQVEVDLDSLTFLDAHGFIPGAGAEVRSRAADGTLTLQLDDGTISIVPELAGQLYVAAG